MDPTDKDQSREPEQLTTLVTETVQEGIPQSPVQLSLPRLPSPTVRSPNQSPSEESVRSPVAQDSILSGRYGPLPPLPAPREITSIPEPIRARTLDTQLSGQPHSRLDWIVPVEERLPVKRTVGERLEPTLLRARQERDNFAAKAKLTGFALNAAIGMQVLLGSLTTGLSAASLAGKQAGIATTVLGALSTLVASYLARARGSKEPEQSISRVKDLEQFIREADSFQMDHGHVSTDEYDTQLFRFRTRFELLLGNNVDYSGDAHGAVESEKYIMTHKLPV